MLQYLFIFLIPYIFFIHCTKTWIYTNILKPKKKDTQV